MEELCNLHIPSLVSDSVNVVEDLVFWNTRVVMEDLLCRFWKAKQGRLVPFDIARCAYPAICEILRYRDRF